MIWRTVVTFGLFLWTNYFILAQAALENTTDFTFSVTAQIVDSEQQPVAIGNVLILSPQDSTLLTGDYFENGKLVLDELAVNPFILQISALGYENYFQRVEVEPNVSTFALGDITLQLQLSEGVEVVAQQSLFEQKGSDLIVNVANTTLSNAGTALDVLQNSPKVISSSGGGISVVGKGAALIYLNGQQIASTQILQNIASNDLKEVQIIENPSARYDAAGRAVINIITKSKTLEGYKIGLVQEVGKGKHFRSYFKGDAYIKTGGLMLQASYGIRPWTRGGREQYFRTFELGNTLTEVDSKYAYSRKILNHDFNLQGNYQLSAKSKIGFQYTGSVLDGQKEALNRNIYYENGSPIFRINTAGEGPYQQKSNTLNTFFERNLDTLGSAFSIAAQYSNYDLDREESFVQDYEDEDVNLITNSQNLNNNQISVFSAQADLNQHFTNNWRWSGGIKNAYVTNSSLLRFIQQGADNQSIVNSKFSQDYEYTENILAAYTEFHWEQNGWSADLGLRGEWTQATGITGGENAGTLFERNYVNVFPSATVNRTFSEDFSANVGYNYRIRRPQFQELNPFVFFVDSLVSLRGNANLLPAYSHALIANFNYKKWNFGVNYTYTKDRINTIIQVEDPNDPAVFAFERRNIKSTDLLALSVSYPIRYKWYSAYFTIIGRMETHQVQDIGSVLNNAKAGYYLFLNQSFQLPAAISLDARIAYTSPRVDGIYVDNPISYVNVSVSRAFFQQHLRVRLLFNDIFDKYKFTGIANFNQSHFNYLSKGDWHFFKVALNWDFGKLGTQQFKNKRISKEELDRLNPLQI